MRHRAGAQPRAPRHRVRPGARVLAAAALSAAVLAGGCGSSSPSAGGSGPTTTLGVLTEVTGLGASADRSSVQGVEAGIAELTPPGTHIRYVVADTATTPAGTLAAAQKLVEADHVDAVVAVSALTFAASQYLTSRGVPVIGSDQDGPEWLTSANMFSVFGRQDTGRVATTVGDFMKMEGVTNVGTLGYSISPLSALAARTYAASARAAGLKTSYVNPGFPFGSTNVQPVALAMKADGVQGWTATVEPSTGLALVAALRQIDAPVKVALLPTGYGGDLLQGGPQAVQGAQGVYFMLTFEPVEMHTAATRRFVDALRKAGVSGEPTFAEYLGYASVALYVQGLEAAGQGAGHARLIAALSRIRGFDAAGLLGTHTIDMSLSSTYVGGPDGCAYMTKLIGQAFQLVPGADPICGPPVAGLRYSP
ncbi:MAG TPA: ABC transporter substrate-binding protein [Acidimicrobiales bacterium]|nr:ABC transporter substrate-binding protein [Acidimicrobiales bacterium]